MNTENDSAELSDSAFLRARLNEVRNELRLAREYLVGARPEPDATALALGNGVVLHGTIAQRIAFFAALSKAQAGYKPIARTRTVVVRPRDGQPYEFDYAPLEEVISATQPALNAQGIAWLCVPAGSELHHMLTHSEGAMLHAVEQMPATESPQKYGSALTYKRRYSYQCLTGTSPEYDDDGNEASGNKVESVAQRQPEKRREPPAAPPQRAPERKPEPKPTPAAAKPAEPSKPASAPPAPAQAVPEAQLPPAGNAAGPNAPSDSVAVPDPSDPGNAPLDQGTKDEIIKLATELKMNRQDMLKTIADRISPTKTFQTLTMADGAALLSVLRSRVQ